MNIELNNTLEKAVVDFLQTKFLENKHKIIHLGKDSVVIEPNIISNTSGMYCLFIHDIPMYYGETDSNIRQRITRPMKVLLGEEHETETHSLGKDLIRISDEYGIPKQWFVNNMTVAYISMYEALKFFDDHVWTVNTLWGPETYRINDIPRKTVLRYFEKLMIQNVGPISNRMLNETSRKKLENDNLFRKLLKSMDAKKAA